MKIASHELRKKSGIYCIENMVNGKIYIGSSKNIEQRLYSHRCYLRNNTHSNQKLQNSWNKHGENAFRCYAIELCSIDELVKREQYYIDILSPWYNIITSVEKVVIPEESRSKMSVSRLEGFKKGTIKLYQEKPIYQYTLSGKFIRGFKSIKEASTVCKISRSSINRFLEGKYKKGGNYLWSITKEDFLPPYIKVKPDRSFLNKPVKVYDLLKNSTTIYDSVTIFSQHIQKNVNAVRHAMDHNYPYLKRYMITKYCRSHE